MFTYNKLLEIYFITRRNKRRSEDSILFEIEYEKKIIKLADALNNRHYRANGNYTFITQNPGANGCREVFAAELSTRILHHYINEELKDVMEHELTPYTFNNRKDKGVAAAVNHVKQAIYEYSNGFTEDVYIIKWDLKAFFMCIKHDIIYKKVMDLIDDNLVGVYDEQRIDDLKWLIYICIYANPAKHCSKKSPDEKWLMVEMHKSLFNQPVGQGAAIGFLIWQMFINFYHNDIDKWFVNELRLPYARFVDDAMALVKNKKAALAYIFPQLREKYKELNIKIQDKKFYCQHYSKGVKFCGSTIKYNRIYPNKRTVRSLTRKIIGFNKVKDKKKFIKDFVNSINSYFGILKQCNSNRIIIESVRRINEQWFEYVQWNPHRRIIEPKPCYDFHHSLSDRYGLEIEHFNKKHKYYYGKP